MATMKTLNGYGFNATELNGKTSDSYLQLGDDGTGSTGEAPKINADTLGGVAASNYLKKTDTASDTSKLGGKAPEYYIQPRNLLDNSDFRNPVNQRGQTSYSGIWAYCIDRWAAWLDESNSATISVVDGGITPFPGMIIQRVASKYIDSNKTYTLAAMTGDGLLVFSGKITTSTSQGSTNANNGIYFNYNADNDLYQFTLAGLTSASKFIWAALYEGTYTADTLPPYVPKGYAAELAECQRYYELVGVHKYSTGRIGEVYFDIQFAQKRVSPTLTMVLEMASNNIANKGEVWNANRMSAGGLLFYANDANLSYWYGSAKVSADL